MIEEGWPSLLRNCPGFLKGMITPIVKAFRGSEVIPFYNVNDYEAWKACNSTSGVRFKYFKG
jgi:hypothetical protein